MYKTHAFNINDFTFKGFGNGLLLAWPFLLFIIAAFLMRFLQLPDNSLIVPNIFHLSSIIFHMLGIAVLEEILCRGLTLKWLLKRAERSKKGIIIACVVSSIIFGAAHITNIFFAGASLLGVSLQIIRTKTLWIPILAHALGNFAPRIFSAIVSYGVLMQNEVVAPTSVSGLIINNILSIVPFLIFGLILFRKVKPEDVEAIMPVSTK